MVRGIEKIELVESIAAKAWPAKKTESYGDWILRIHEGVTKRANSVFTVGKMPSSNNWLEEIEKFYETNNVVPCFYITEVTPSTLDDILQRKGYEKETDIYILSGKSKAITECIIESAELTVDRSDYVTEEWMDSFLTLEGHTVESESAFQQIFQQIHLEKSFITLYKENEVTAVATVAIEDGWGYVSNVVVNKQFRRQGIAQQLLLQLARWAKDKGAKQLFMQVLAHNEPALKLYEKLGFTILAKSHYRIKPLNLHKKHRALMRQL